MKWVVLGLMVMSQSVFAHNMPRQTKVDSIKTALESVIPEFRLGRVDFEFSEYALTLGGLKDLNASGDQDIEEFFAEISIDDNHYQINCDLISGEYIIRENTIAQYFLIYKNCKKKNLENYQVEYIQLPLQKWEDWKY